MNFLEQRIIEDGIVKPGDVLKVDSFLNHQMDIHLLDEIGREFKRRFGHKHITKVLTIESSGIALAIAGKVVGRELTGTDQSNLIDHFIEELGDGV